MNITYEFTIGIPSACGRFNISDDIECRAEISGRPEDWYAQASDIEVLGTPVRTEPLPRLPSIAELHNRAEWCRPEQDLAKRIAALLNTDFYHRKRIDAAFDDEARYGPARDRADYQRKAAE